MTLLKKLRLCWIENEDDTINLLQRVDRKYGSDERALSTLLYILRKITMGTPYYCSKLDNIIKGV